MTHSTRIGLPLLIAAGVSLATVVMGLLIAGPTKPEVLPLSTPLSSIDTTLVTVPRTDWCTAVDPTTISTALGAEIDSAQAWRNGDEATLGDRTDVAHEFGCRWSTADATPVSVATWTFASPVTSERAGAIRAKALKAEGCTEFPSAAFGNQSLALECSEGKEAPTTQVRYQGLFGDAWVTCEVIAPATSPALNSADGWCAAVLETAATSS